MKAEYACLARLMADIVEVRVRGAEAEREESPFWELHLRAAHVAHSDQRHTRAGGPICAYTLMTSDFGVTLKPRLRK